MCFRKRSPIRYPSVFGSCRDVVEDSSGRSSVYVSVSDYNSKHSLPAEEFSLTDMLSSGVPLKEIPCGNLLDSSDPIEHPIDVDSVSNYINNLNE